MKSYFETLSKNLFAALSPNEHLNISLQGDDTQFVRINGSKVRQSGVVENYYFSFLFISGSSEKALKSATGQITLSMDLKEDEAKVIQWIKRFREDLVHFPFDPYAELPKAQVQPSQSDTKGQLLARAAVVDELLTEAGTADLAGLYSAGSVVRAMANSAGLFHWFATESFSFDYSLFTVGQKAIKTSYSGHEWSGLKYRTGLQSALAGLKQFQTPSRKLERGDYRVYLAPAAFEDLVQMFSWHAVSEMAIRKSQSSFRYLRSGEKTLSEKFTLHEDFSGGEMPRFNQKGDLAPVKQTIIEKGKLKTTLINERTAMEFGIKSNAANTGENLRSPVVDKGDLQESEILKRLGTGLYLSNLHYLNWSDESNGRITGMTRYACFWVENGQIVAPIDNLRFDESVFDLFGGSLEALTDFDEYHAVTRSYSNREIGGARTPGALLSKMHFSL